MNNGTPHNKSRETLRREWDKQVEVTKFKEDERRKFVEVEADYLYDLYLRSGLGTRIQDNKGIEEEDKDAVYTVILYLARNKLELGQ